MKKCKKKRRQLKILEHNRIVEFSVLKICSFAKSWHGKSKVVHLFNLRIFDSIIQMPIEYHNKNWILSQVKERKFWMLIIFNYSLYSKNNQEKSHKLFTSNWKVEMLLLEFHEMGSILVLVRYWFTRHEISLHFYFQQKNS